MKDKLMCEIFKVPAFETRDGNCITESNAIAYYGKTFSFKMSSFRIYLFVKIILIKLLLHIYEQKNIPHF